MGIIHKQKVTIKKLHDCVIKSEIKAKEILRSNQRQKLRYNESTVKKTIVSHRRTHRTAKHIKMDYVKKVDDLSFEGNVAENWRSFKKAFDVFELAADCNKKKDDTRIAIFLNAAGKEALKLFDTLPLTEADRKSYTKVVEAYENFCIPRKNVVYERFLFYSRNQKDGETFDSFLVDIKKLSKTCEFADNKDDMIRDRIVLGIADKGLQEKMLKNNMKLEDAIELCRATELARGQSKDMRRDIVEQVIHEVGKTRKEYPAASNNKNQNYKRQQRRNTCNRCNIGHGKGKCPAFGKTCNNCQKPNHFAIACRMKKIKSIVTVENDDGEIFLHSVKIVNVNNVNDSKFKFRNRRGWIEFIRVNDKIIAFKFDTGSDVNVLPLNLLKRIDNNAIIYRTGDILEAYNGQKLIPVGECFLVCMYNNEVTLEKFVIINENLSPILGLTNNREVGFD